MYGPILFSILIFLVGPIGWSQSKAKNSNSTNKATTDWIQKYVVTKQLNDPLAQCATFRLLAQDRKFPLKDFAQMRASLVCGEWNEEASKWTPELSWLRARWSLLRTDMLRGKQPESLQLAESLQDNLKYTTLQEKRVQLLQQAIELAEKNKKSEFQAELQMQLEKIAPRFKKKFEKSETLSVAKDFQRSRNFPKAKALYLEILNKDCDHDDKKAAWHGLARIEKIEQDKMGHIHILEKYLTYLKTTADVKRMLDTEVDLARAIWTIGQTQKALKILKARLSQKIKGQSFAMQNWLVGRIYEELKKLDQSVLYFNKSLEEPIKDVAFRDTVEWDLAWMLFKMKRYTEAIQHFQKIIDLSENEFQKARAQYWQSQAFSELSQVELNIETLRTLMERDPLGYYGMLAHRELGAPLQKPKPKKDGDQTLLGKMATAKIYEPAWVDWMILMGEVDSITPYINSVVEEYKKEKDQDDRVWLSVLKSYAKGGDYLKLFEKLYEIDPKVRAEILSEHPDLLFPTPYLEQVQIAGTRFGVEPSLIYSITRQESAFNPEARSGADAMGLMQLLPSVAKKIGKEIKVEVKDYHDLFIPEKNLLLGSYLLSQQMKRHKNEFIAYVASYNASDEAIRMWKKTRRSANPRQFIEDIPYEETRSYVRLIMRNYIFYKLMLTNEKELKFPEEVF